MAEKLIALTFDDGPCEGVTDKILDILEENGAAASFFLIGDLISEKTEYLVKRAYDMGCSIENHSKTHGFMTSFDESQIQSEIKYTTDKIIEITGEAPKFFRPPYIDYNQKMYDVIDLGFICGHGCEDWENSVTAEMRIERVLNEAYDGCIILLHDMENNMATVEAVKKIIPALKAQGYKCVNIRELFSSKGVSPQRNCIYDGACETRKNYN